MIKLLNFNAGSIMDLAGVATAFLLTCLALQLFKQKLPKDQGREFAHEGKLSAGKPRGAGFIFIMTFLVVSLLFSEVTVELVIYILLVVAAMITGYLDDCAKFPWGEYKKGLLDLIIAVLVAVTFLNFNSSTIDIAIAGFSVTIPPILFGVLVVILVWTSINVTNCTDGVDGLSATLAIITLATIYLVDLIKGSSTGFDYVIILFITCLMGYLWFNATPSRLIMGDAGSRAMGLFISIAVLKTNSPLLYIPIAIVMILDGGLGLIKVSLLRFCKIRILKNVRTPLHDQARKVNEWSNTQTVFRFAIIQIMVSVGVLYLVYSQYAK